MAIMANKGLKFFIIPFSSLIFFLAIAFDITPYLRGPAEYPPDWRWPYLFINTLTRLWLPLLVVSVSIFWFHHLLKKNNAWIEKKEKYIFPVLVLICFSFQLSVLFFSRAGINVLIHRIINPDLNGYFSASLNIENIGEFLRNFNNNVLGLPQHAQGHPPGAILFFYFLNKLFSLFPFLNSLVNNLSPFHGDVRNVWVSLTLNQKLGAIFSSFFIPFLASLIIIPVYFIGKIFYSSRVGLYSGILYIFVPSLTLFTPLNDVFIPIFPVTAFLLFILGLKKENKFLLLVSGLISSMAIFFSISIIPLFLLFSFFFIHYFFKTQRFASRVIFFIFGLLVFPVVLYAFFGFNFVKVGQTLMSGLPESRSYLLWLFYNLYDFFVFSGIPVMIVFTYLAWSVFQTVFKKQWGKIDIIAFSFLVMIVLLDLSGSVRGEVARIWLPFYPFLVLIVSNFLINHKFSKFELIIIIFLQAVQVVIMQEFWVPLW